MLNINNHTPINFCGNRQNNKVISDIEKQYENMKIDWIDSSENLEVPPEVFYNYLLELENQKQSELLKLDLEA